MPKSPRLPLQLSRMKRARRRPTPPSLDRCRVQSWQRTALRRAHPGVRSKDGEVVVLLPVPKRRWGCACSGDVSVYRLGLYVHQATYLAFSIVVANA
jgi:hypothetical protein